MKNVSFTSVQYVWTKHAFEKMKYYHLSEQRVKRVIRNPDRIEEGIAPGTVAVSQRTGPKKSPKEIWVMYQIVKSKIKNQKSKLRIISSWRYPGVSHKGKPIEIPPDVMEDLKGLFARAALV